MAVFRPEFERSDVERIYRAIADREPTMELLQLVYDTFGETCDLRPPVNELRLAGLCETGVRARG
ncbi:hypothetical protein ASD52_06470 [Ensifer sp. Root142]|uniref:hypothetical protein n=1 Tax=Ensifer sp. Root142 TaxID=1736461 RepID=UPI00070B6CBD|nr:hypothetical protein [Ensifer sp. Root142]KQY71325.1 hypothetical protein ASD52_06470 [Ensifer sp. Root142]